MESTQSPDLCLTSMIYEGDVVWVNYQLIDSSNKYDRTKRDIETRNLAVLAALNKLDSSELDNIGEMTITLDVGADKFIYDHQEWVFGASYKTSMEELMLFINDVYVSQVAVQYKAIADVASRTVTLRQLQESFEVEHIYYASKSGPVFDPKLAPLFLSTILEQKIVLTSDMRLCTNVNTHVVFSPRATDPLLEDVERHSLAVPMIFAGNRNPMITSSHTHSNGSEVAEDRSWKRETLVEKPGSLEDQEAPRATFYARNTDGWSTWSVTKGSKLYRGIEHIRYNLETLEEQRNGIFKEPIFVGPEQVAQGYGNNIEDLRVFTVIIGLFEFVTGWFYKPPGLTVEYEVTEGIPHLFDVGSSRNVAKILASAVKNYTANSKITHTLHKVLLNDEEAFLDYMKYGNEHTQDWSFSRQIIGKPSRWSSYERDSVLIAALRKFAPSLDGMVHFAKTEKFHPEMMIFNPEKHLRVRDVMHGFKFAESVVSYLQRRGANRELGSNQGSAEMEARRDYLQSTQTHGVYTWPEKRNWSEVEGIHEFFESLIRGVKDSKIDYNLRLP